MNDFYFYELAWALALSGLLRRFLIALLRTFVVDEGVVVPSFLLVDSGWFAGVGMPLPDGFTWVMKVDREGVDYSALCFGLFEGGAEVGAVGVIEVWVVSVFLLLKNLAVNPCLDLFWSFFIRLEFFAN